MRFSNPALQAALEAWRQDPRVRERANADNIAFDERVSPPRQAAFENRANTVADSEALRFAHIAYVRDYMEVGDGVPHTFEAGMVPALLSNVGLDLYQTIVRLESLSRIFSYWRPHPGPEPLDVLRTAIASGEHATVDEFLSVWNDSSVRDHRPAFAAWKDQLSGELDGDDWPDRLRDRLGLEHYKGDDLPMPVALMEYRVFDVMQEAGTVGVTGPVVVPTALDTRPGPYFFPSPREMPYGRVMSLAPILSDDDLLAEMLHVRMPYRRNHIARLGTIDRQPSPHDLKGLRNNHLHALRIASLRDDFGEEIP
jgi:hypothetical protein